MDRPRIQDYTAGGINPIGEPRWQQVLDANDLGAIKPRVPLLQYHGLADEVIPWQVEAALHSQWCAMGVTTLFTSYPGDHIIPYIFRIMGDRSLPLPCCPQTRQAVGQRSEARAEPGRRIPAPQLACDGRCREVAKRRRRSGFVPLVRFRMPIRRDVISLAHLCVLPMIWAREKGLGDGLKFQLRLRAATRLSTAQRETPSSAPPSAAPPSGADVSRSYASPGRVGLRVPPRAQDAGRQAGGGGDESGCEVGA